jgi:subtilase family serine protease
VFIRWLRSSGFTDIQKEDVELDYRPVSFTGSVAVTKKAFRTQIYSYSANPAYVLEPTIPDETYYVNATNVSIPAAFQKLVGKIGGLDARPTGGVCNDYPPHAAGR